MSWESQGWSSRSCWIVGWRPAWRSSGLRCARVAWNAAIPCAPNLLGLAIVNGEEVGQTPVSRSFYYYGDREITFILDGYATKTLIQPIKAPWWDNLFFEFFTENLVPFNLRDEREFKYQLTPASTPRASDLRDRAEQLRSEAQTLPKPRRGGFLGWLGFID